MVDEALLFVVHYKSLLQWAEQNKVNLKMILKKCLTKEDSV